jgi:hypothetical protein
MRARTGTACRGAATDGGTHHSPLSVASSLVFSGRNRQHTFTPQVSSRGPREERAAVPGAAVLSPAVAAGAADGDNGSASDGGAGAAEGLLAAVADAAGGGGGGGATATGVPGLEPTGGLRPDGAAGPPTLERGVPDI